MTNSLLTEQQEQLAAIEELIRKTSSAQEDLKKSVSEKRELAEKEQMRDLEDCESTAVANREATRQKKRIRP